MTPPRIPVRFDAALALALAFAQAHREEFGDDVVVVRDLIGRIRLAIAACPKNTEELAADLHDQLGAFSPGADQIFLLRDEMLAPEAVFQSEDARRLGDGVRVLERQVTGADWSRAPLPRAQKEAARVTFFGIKGGVGRSTALVAVARHLAEREERVLVVDLDLESPGVTASLLPPEARPNFGVVDWFVEDDVGQADETLLREMVATSPLARGTAGEIRVVPALGTTGTDGYVAKLSRVFASPPGKGDAAHRLARLVDSLEAQERPAWILLDSRAGIHDLAAIAVTRLGATASLLFAIDTPQTWLAYELLFATWARDTRLLRGFRDGLRIIAAQVPETGRDPYIERLRDHASLLFTDHIYEEMEEKKPEEEDGSERFNFDVSDDDAPHAPVPVYWGREFQDWDPTAQPAVVTDDQVRAAFGKLFDYFDALVAAEVTDA